MKKLKQLSVLLCLAMFFSITKIYSQVYVEGYYKKNGTYVEGHYRSSPNSTKNDNYSTKGNVNPYTGEEGTKKPDPEYNYNYNYETPKPKEKSEEESVYPN